MAFDDPQAPLDITKLIQQVGSLIGAKDQVMDGTQAPAAQPAPPAGDPLNQTPIPGSTLGTVLRQLIPTLALGIGGALTAPAGSSAGQAAGRGLLGAYEGYASQQPTEKDLYFQDRLKTAALERQQLQYVLNNKAEFEKLLLTIPDKEEQTIARADPAGWGKQRLASREADRNYAWTEKTSGWTPEQLALYRNISDPRDRNKFAISMWEHDHPKAATAMIIPEPYDFTKPDGTVVPGARARNRHTGEWYGDPYPVLPKNTKASDAPAELVDPGVPVNGPGGRLLYPDVLTNANPAEGKQAQQLAEYKIPYPVGTASKDPMWKRVISLAGQYDPSFDATQYQTRLNIRKDFTSGATSRIRDSINTVVSHIDELEKRSRDLDNYGWQSANSVKNFLSKERGNPAVTNFELAREAVANELMRVYRGTGAGSTREVEEWKKRIDTSQSPEQLSGAVQESLSLLEGKMASMQNKYERGMGHPLDFMQQGSENIGLFSPEAASAYNDLNARLKRSGIDGSVSVGKDNVSLDKPDHPPSEKEIAQLRAMGISDKELRDQGWIK